MFVGPGERAGRKRFLGLLYWTEAQSIDAPNLTKPVSSFTPKTSSANADAAIVPAGTGAILGAIPDNVQLGGNKRGLYSVDLQLRRTTNTMVAGGDYSAVVGGRNGQIDPSVNPVYSGIFVGVDNSILGGAASAKGSVIIGGNTHSITDNGANGPAAILGGGAVTITQAGSTGYQSAVGGFSLNVSGNGAISLGGREHNNSAPHAVTFGYQTKSRCEAAIYQGCQSGTVGSAQTGSYVLQKQTSDAVAISLSANGSLADNTNQVGPLPNNSSFAFTGQVCCHDTGGNASMWNVSGLIKNSGGTVSLVGSTVGTPVQDAGLAATVLSLSADNVNKCLAVNVTGIATFTIGWTCHINTTERV